MASFTAYPDTHPASSTEMAQPPRQQPGSACDECRRKKLRCDRKKPQCMACANAGIECVMRSNCPRRGPKKGHLKALRNQIATLESRLNEQRDEEIMTRQIDSQHSSNTENEGGSSEGDDGPRYYHSGSSTDMTPNLRDLQTWSAMTMNPLDDPDNLHSSMNFPPLVQIPVGVHLTPLICTDLDQLYFDRVHPFAPLIQKSRYLSWSRQLNKSKQKLCLQYAIWTLASSFSSQFQLIQPEIYTEARQRLDALEMDTQETCLTCIEQIQAWMLLSIYELTSETCNYQRGLMSAGRAFRLVQLMGLHEIDRHGSVTRMNSWIDIEYVRRTFWIAYGIDRFTSVIDGLPLTFNEREIHTRLPNIDAQYMGGRPSTMCFLSEVMNRVEKNDALTDIPMSSFTESIIIATICGRNLENKHRPAIEHPSLNTFLMTRINTLSVDISSASEDPNPMLIFVALTAQMVVFMLCEDIESKAMTSKVAGAVIAEHEQLSLDAVHELSRLIDTLGHLNYFQNHPLTPIPLLISARFCLAHIGVNEAYSSLMPGIATTLQGLTSVNGLAQHCLRLLGLNLAHNGGSL